MCRTCLKCDLFFISLVNNFGYEKSIYIELAEKEFYDKTKRGLKFDVKLEMNDENPSIPRNSNSNWNKQFSKRKTLKLNLFLSSILIRLEIFSFKDLLTSKRLNIHFMSCEE